MTRSTHLPPADSPLTTVFLGQYVSSLMRETIKYLQLSYADLAPKMFIPEVLLRDAVEGKMALTRGQWIRLGHLLDLPTTYELRPGERDGLPCWEICFPPIRVRVDEVETPRRAREQKTGFRMILRAWKNSTSKQSPR